MLQAIEYGECFPSTVRISSFHVSTPIRIIIQPSYLASKGVLWGQRCSLRRSLSVYMVPPADCASFAPGQKNVRYPPRDEAY